MAVTVADLLTAGVAWDDLDGLSVWHDEAQGPVARELVSHFPDAEEVRVSVPWRVIDSPECDLPAEEAVLVDQPAALALLRSAVFGGES